MPLIDLDDANFDDETQKGEIMILDFWAPWCAPCHAFAPVFETVASRHPEILFGRINTDAEPKLAQQFEIFSIPTLIAAKNDTIIYARPGAVSEAKLESIIKDLQELQLPNSEETP